MPKYRYSGPRAGVCHPETGDRLVLQPGRTYDLSEGSLPGLMSPRRSEDIGKLTLLAEEEKPSAKPVNVQRPSAANKKETKPSAASSTAIAAASTASSTASSSTDS